MHHKIILTGIFSAITFLTGCVSHDVVYTQFGREAGATMDTGEFGNATQNNLAYATGQKKHMVNLHNRFTTEVNNSVHFAFNSAKLDSNARRILNAQAKWIHHFPEVRFSIYGHTDAVGSEAYNKRLGKQRANAVLNYLVSRGVKRNRLEMLQSFGESQPVIASGTAEQTNRRAITQVRGFMKNHPNVLDGNYAQIIHREYIDSATAATTITPTTSTSGG